MDILDFLRALRRRWRVIVVITLAAAFSAFLTAPAADERDALPVGTTYIAKTTLLKAPDAQQVVDLALVRLYVTTGDIPKRAADRLGFDGAPAQLASRLTVAGNDEVGTVEIVVTADTAREAEQIANTFAEEAIAFLGESGEANQQRAIQVTNRAINAATESLGEIDDRRALEPEDSTRRAILDAQRAAVLAQLESLYTRLGELTTATASRSPLNILERAQGYPDVIDAASFQAPSGRSSRLILGLLLGLALGGAAALLVERLDTRIGDRVTAAAAFGLPVVAEIPYLPRRARRASTIASVTHPEGAVAEAFRSLRATLLLMPSRLLHADEHGEGRRKQRPGGKVVLVTAATGGSGKTTTAANLAVALAESGRRVLIVDADLRNPAVHRFFGVSTAEGITDLAMSGSVGELERIVQTSPLAPVLVLAAGAQTVAGSTIEATLPALFSQARELADVVVVDSAPLLSGSDALDVIPHVDTVVMVGRMRRTTREQAQHARELLSRISVPVLGVALIGSRTAPATPSGTTTVLDRISTLRVPAIHKNPRSDASARRSRVLD